MNTKVMLILLGVFFMIGTVLLVVACAPAATPIATPSQNSLTYDLILTDGNSKTVTGVDNCYVAAKVSDGFVAECTRGAVTVYAGEVTKIVLNH